MPLLDDIKVVLRISSSNKVFDGEITDLIETARHDLKMAGISNDKADAETEIDPLVKRAITTYVKANFGWDNKDSDKLNQAYESLKNHMTLVGDYIAI